MSALNEAHFTDELAAYAFVEARVWPDGRVCPHCGVIGESSAMKGKSTRIGTYKCYACRKPFTVKVGTIFEASHIPMHVWLQAMYLLSSSKKGMSANQLHRTLGVTLKAAWFMAHRIRKAMAPSSTEPMGGEGKVVEADETYIGTLTGVVPGAGGGRHKMKVVSLVEREGRSRSVSMPSLTSKAMHEHLRRNVDPASRLISDEANYYKSAPFENKDRVHHTLGEYVRGDVHTNTVEGFFSVFKRGMKGIYQHCDQKHLDRYLAEFDFRYSNRVALGVGDKARTVRALKGVSGKRLMFKDLIA